MKRQFYIDGQWVDSASGTERAILNPSDATTIAMVAEGGREDAKAAIKAGPACLLTTAAGHNPRPRSVPGFSSSWPI